MKNKIQITFILLAVILYLLKNVFGYSPTLINILNDFIALPAILIVLAFIMKKIYGTKFSMSIDFLCLTFLTISILFEIIFPLASKNSTSDASDILLYFIGGIFYFTLVEYLNPDSTNLKKVI